MHAEFGWRADCRVCMDSTSGLVHVVLCLSQSQGGSSVWEFCHPQEGVEKILIGDLGLLMMFVRNRR